MNTEKMIAEVLREENKKNPLTDEEIAKKLNILREIVTEYRKKNNIANSRNRRLEYVKTDALEILKKDRRCKGGWHYGSISRGESDIYSDYDPVFLVSDEDFQEFSQDVPKILSDALDELLIFWGESFNDDHFKNYCSVIRLENNLHQFDFFIINSKYIEDWMCRQHLKGCTKDDIIFDRTGEVENLLSIGLRTDNYIPDIIRAMDTYWFHTEMLIKYFKRKDIFKILKNIDILFHSHVD